MIYFTSLEKDDILDPLGKKEEILNLLGEKDDILDPLVKKGNA